MQYINIIHCSQVKYFHKHVIIYSNIYTIKNFNNDTIDKMKNVEFLSLRNIDVTFSKQLKSVKQLELISSIMRSPVSVEHLVSINSIIYNIKYCRRLCAHMTPNINMSNINTFNNLISLTMDNISRGYNLEHHNNLQDVTLSNILCPYAYIKLPKSVKRITVMNIRYMNILLDDLELDYITIINYRTDDLYGVLSKAKNIKTLNYVNVGCINELRNCSKVAEVVDVS